MRRLLGMALAVVMAAAATLAVGVSAAQAADGFSINNGRLVDANGSDFVMRGINLPYMWFTGKTGMFADAKAAGANTARVVLTKGATTDQVSTAVNLCKTNKLVCILEVHDTTGWAQGNGAITLSQAADFWLGVKSAFVNEQKYVLVNLGNEPQTSGTDATWVTQTKTAISKLRDGGITNTLVADGPGYGQDPNNLAANNASDIENSDSQHNTLFSVHMYSVYANASTVSSYINFFADRKLPLIVGEFGHHLGNSPVAWQQVLTTAQERSIGWLAWSWSGNAGSDAQLDMTNNFNANSLTSWGNDIVNGANGLKATSKESSIFGAGNGSPTPGPTPPTPGPTTPDPAPTTADPAPTSPDPAPTGRIPLPRRQIPPRLLLIPVRLLLTPVRRLRILVRRLRILVRLLLTPVRRLRILVRLLRTPVRRLRIPARPCRRPARRVEPE